MLDIIISLLAVWLLYKAICLTFKLTWGAAKVMSSILIALAVPLFIVCLVFIGGFFLLIPTALIAGAIGLAKLC